MANRINFSRMPWQGQLFSFPQGPIGKAIVESDEFLRSQLGKTIWYNEQTKTYEGSNNQLAIAIDSVVREASSGAVRVATLQDTNEPTCRRMIKGNYYVDVPEIYVFTPSGEVAEQIQQLAADRNVTFTTPCRATGIDVLFESGQVRYIARPDFALTQNDALDFRNNTRKFTEMRDGFPVFDENGAFIWYINKEGSARVCRSSDLYAGGDDADFVGSFRDGRVVLTTAEGSSPEIYAEMIKTLQANCGKQIAV